MWTITFVNLHKYIVKFDNLNPSYAHCTHQVVEDLTNTFGHLNKYLLSNMKTKTSASPTGNGGLEH